jgi:pimeloyl-ACP methyl ester carboxylesterase
VRARFPVLLGAAALVLAGCAGGPGGPAFRPTYRQVRCPADVEVQLVTPHSCGYLTVPQDRSEPRGPRIKVFVVKIVPAGVTPSADPVLSFGSDLGFGQGIGGMAPLAQRVHRISYLMDPRGTGHSQPSLACPEVAALTAPGRPAQAGDAALRQRFLGAVRACRNKLTRAGINLADYDLTAIAADAADLRRALGVREWNLASYGSYSDALLQTLRLYPAGVRAAFADSPSFPQADPFTESIDGTRWALGQLFAACRRDPRCNHAYPDLQRSWARALDRLSRHPVTVTVPGSGAAVTIDGRTLVLAARAALGNEGSGSVVWLPAAIAAAAAGRVGGQLLDAIQAQWGLYVYGYQPGVYSAGAFSLGAYLSVVCRDQAPFTGPAAMASAAAGNRSYRVFVDNPYLAACRIWDVPPAPPQVHQAVTTSVPILILTGQFDAFSPGPDALAAARSFARAWVIQIPWQTHNVLSGSGCALAIRNAWLDDPTRAPGTACAAQIRPVPFDTSSPAATGTGAN